MAVRVPHPPVLGVLDWGIGGLFALREVRARQPSANLIYLSDAGSVPYGRQSRAELQRSVARALSFLRLRGATHVLVACHSASSVLPLLDMPHTTGVIAPQHVPMGGRIGVVGGARTVRSQVWRRALSHPHNSVRQRIAQPWSAAVEAGRLDTLHTRALVRQVLAPLRGVDTLVLACTHYIALAPLIAEEAHGARIIDPALACAAALAVPAGHGRLEALTTGRPDAVNAVVERVFPELPLRFGAVTLP